MELVRYRPGEAIRWLQMGAETHKKTAGARGKETIQVEDRPIAKTLMTAASALVELTKGAYTELLHAQASAAQYVLLEEQFDVVTRGTIKSVRYDRVVRILAKGDRAVLELDRGQITIKPFAHVVAGRAKVPVGWSRNGTEVPYELLIEELAARCRKHIEEV